MLRNGRSLGVLNKPASSIVTLGSCGDYISTDSALRAFVSENEYRAIKKSENYFE